MLWTGWLLLCFWRETALKYAPNLARKLQYTNKPKAIVIIILTMITSLVISIAEANAPVSPDYF